MAEPVSRPGIMARAFCSFWLLSSLAFAQTIKDPTRPPNAISVAHGEMAASAVADPVLQSILISPVRKMAIISGQMVTLQGKFGDSRLIHISETEVVLRNGKTEQILRLFPDIKRQPVTHSAR